jgi:branched-chain amino acid transport system substrate-binding protein
LPAGTTASGGTTAGSATTGTGAGTGEEIRVLVSAPLTGDSAEIGQALLRGAQLAAKDINDAGGIPSGPHKGAMIKIESADDQLSTDAATTIGSKYVDDKGLWMLTGFYSSGQAQAAGQVAARSNLSVCTPSGAPFLTTDNKNIFSVSPDFSSLTGALVDYLYNDMGVRSVALIRTDFSYIDELEKGIKAQASKDGMKIVSEQTYTYGSTQDFKTYISTAAAAKPDVILDASLQTEKGQIFRQENELGIKIPIVDWGGEGLDNTFLGIAGNLAVGAMQINPGPILTAGNDAWKTMQTEWTAAYNEPLKTPAAMTYQCILYLEKALENGAKTREDLINVLPTVTGGEGPFGPLGFTDRQQTSTYGVVTSFTGTTYAAEDIKAVFLLSHPYGFTRQ